MPLTANSWSNILWTRVQRNMEPPLRPDNFQCLRALCLYCVMYNGLFKLLILAIKIKKLLNFEIQIFSND